MFLILIIAVSVFILLVEFAETQHVAVREGRLLVDQGRLKITTVVNCPNCCPEPGICPTDCSGCPGLSVTISTVTGSCCCTLPLNGVTAAALTRTGCTWTVLVFTPGFSAVRINIICDASPDPDQWQIEVLLLSPPFTGGCPSCSFAAPIDRWVGTINAKGCANSGPAGVYSAVTDGLGPNCTAVSPLTVTVA